MVSGVNGEKLGIVDGIYNDNETEVPAWAAVRSDLSGSAVSLVPLATATVHGDTLHVPFDEEQLASAPHHDPGRALSRQDEIDLFRHYRVSYDTGADSEPSDLSGDAMTRSEERLLVHTESHAVERVRLRKHVVTEYQQVTVPVRREELRIEREPVEPASGRADPGATAAFGGDEELEIVLYAERPVVATETVAVERVRIGKRTVTAEETVSGEVRREEIELDTDPEGPR